MKKFLTTTCILGVTLCVYTDSAHAYEFKKLNITDTEFNTNISTGKWSESWVAQARVGDAASGSPNRTYEVNLQDITTACAGGTCTQTFETPIPTSAQSNFQWQSGKSYDFNLDFNATADADANAANGVGKASLTFTGNNPLPTQTTTVTLNDLMDSGEKINSLLVRVVAPTNGTSSVTVGDKLEISDDGFIDLANYGDKLIANSGSNPRDIKYLQINGINGDFQLDGQTIFQWAGITNLPKDSQLAFQVKGMLIPVDNPGSEVPEPATISLFSIGFLAAVGSRFRRAFAE